MLKRKKIEITYSSIHVDHFDLQQSENTVKILSKKKKGNTPVGGREVGRDVDAKEKRD